MEGEKSYLPDLGLGFTPSLTNAEITAHATFNSLHFRQRF
jgi:hypothetical protein